MGFTVLVEHLNVKFNNYDTVVFQYKVLFYVPFNVLFFVVDLLLPSFSNMRNQKTGFTLQV